MESGSLLKGISLLQEINNASCSTNRINQMKKLCDLVNAEFSLEEWLGSLLFIDELNKLLSNSVVHEFSDRDFTSYDKDDFSDYDVLAHSVLELIVKIIPLNFSNQNQEAHQSQNQQRTCGLANDLLDDAEKNDGNLGVLVTGRRENILNILPNLIVLIAGNIRNPVWSSQECQSLCQQILNNFVLDASPNHDLQDILISNTYFLNNQLNLSKSRENNILGNLFHLLEKPLTRNRWGKNPFLCEVFIWLVLQVKSPNLSSHVDQVMATSLNFIHSHETGNKLNGLQTLIHLISNISGEELRWYNRADVMFETVKNQMYSKEEHVLDAVLQCTFLLLKVLERYPLEQSDKHHEVMESLLRNAEMENLLVIRRVLMAHVGCCILDYGILCTRHLCKILQVIETFLEVDDAPQETARLQALQALENILIVAWPIIIPKSKHILQFLLKFVFNIEAKSSEEGKCLDVLGTLRAKVYVCVNLLLKLDPALYLCLEEIKQSDNLLMLRDVCN